MQVLADKDLVIAQQQNNFLRGTPLSLSFHLSKIEKMLGSVVKQSLFKDPHLDLIFNEIQLHENLLSGIGVNYGISGWALLQFECSDCFNLPHLKEQATNALQKAFEMLNNDYVSESLYREINELALFVILCCKNNWIPAENLEQLKDFDQLILSLANDALQNDQLDPVTGATAFAYYLLERADDNPHFKNNINEIVQKWIKTAIHCKDGIYWHSKFKEGNPVYLGITHGSSNFILFLQKAFLKGVIDASLTKKLITKTAFFIYQQKDESHYQIFPTVIDKKYTDLYPKGYCYGDYGTLYALLSASVFTHNDHLLKETLRLFELIHNKGYDYPYLIAGPGLLYGNAGIAMLFRKMYELFPYDPFMKAYYSKMQEVMNLIQPDEPFIGLKGYWNQEIDATNYSLNEGMIGIFLEMLNYRGYQNRKTFEYFFFLLQA